MNVTTKSWLLGSAMLTALSAYEPAVAQFGAVEDCMNGQNCCLIARTNSHPYRYALACDGLSASATIALSMQGYLQPMFGPVAYPVAAGWMANARIPGWEGSVFPGYRYAPPPAPDRECFLGQSCCAVGRQAMDGAFAWAYDGGAQTCTGALMQSNYRIVLEPASPEFCHFWWNQNVAAVGLGQWNADATPSGAIPFADNAEQALTPPGIAGALALSPNAWQQLPGYVAAIQSGSGGLLLRGGAWTNGREVDGRRDGNGVQSAQSFDLGGGGSVYLRFSIDAGGQYAAVFPGLFGGVSVRHLSTHHSWAGSAVIPEQTSVYVHLKVAPGGAYALAIALGGYDDRGGQVIESAHGQLKASSGPLLLYWVDNYAGENSALTIEEAIVR